MPDYAYIAASPHEIRRSDLQRYDKGAEREQPVCADRPLLIWHFDERPEVVPPLAGACLDAKPNHLEELLKHRRRVEGAVARVTPQGLEISGQPFGEGIGRFPDVP